ncbi:MAG: hypothetical protein RLZZ630_2165 [Bacteroidota bacterium]|jgi:NAD-dependent deacetylase
MKRLVVFTGAGVSAESGIRTFRDSDGLWEEYAIEEVATPGAWLRDREKVLHFYNLRRRQVLEAQPNAAHLSLAMLEKYFDVYVVTQNIDDLHERAGTTKVLHLHGEIRKSRSTVDPSLVYPIEGSELTLGDRCAKGSQLRPHIVWFGEAVPAMDDAIAIVSRADVFVVIGTSLEVYPAASLIHYAPESASNFLIDPRPSVPSGPREFHILTQTACSGVPALADQLIREYVE